MNRRQVSLAIVLSCGVALCAAPPKAPFLLEATEDVSHLFPGAPRIQSFASAEWQGKWIFIAGRVSGYHGEGGKDADFPRSGANSRVWVIDPPTDKSPAKTYSLPLTPLPAAVRDQWMSSNPQYAQVGDTLYILGGYGQNSAGQYLTYPLISTVHLPSLVKAATTGGDLAMAQVRFAESPLAQLSGGELLALDDKYFYLVGGHKFMGSYLDFQASGEKNTATASQTYSSAITKLQIHPTTLAIKAVETWTDPEFRRRDLNVAHTLSPDGHTLGAAAFGGVFTANQLGFSKPIYWSAAQPPAVNKSYDQKMSAYTCAHLSLFDPDSGDMHTTFFGGISGNLWSPDKQAFEPAPREGDRASTHYRDGMQWIDRITTLTVTRDGAHVEVVQPASRLAGYVGANAVFLPAPGLARLRPEAEIFDLRALRGRRTLVGYIFGGIRAFPRQFPYHDNSPEYRSGNVPTRASELILAVYITAHKPGTISED